MAQRVQRLVRHLSPVQCVGSDMEYPSDAVIYLNGQWVPDKEALVSIHDQSFIHGFGCFDTCRTYNGKVIPDRMRMHIDRFFQSIKALNMESPLSKQEWCDVLEEMVRRNQHMLPKWGGDFWCFVRLTPGVNGSMTSICEPVKIPFAARAKKYIHGITMASVGMRRIPPECIPPRVKLHSYVNNMLADMEASAKDKDALALMQDMRGNIAEGSTYNFFLVQDGKIFTPREQFALAGVSRATVFRLAAELSICCEERDLDMYDVYNADEAFLTSTSLCMCPVKKVNGRAVGEEGTLWGPVSAKLRDAYKDLVGLDFVAQYLAFADDS
mmetsp:Transcript_91947/g.162276  ORF Transcript_91947/g.162276 Transcript_91947/m.162276 type:complete len:326 (+) Transcript_91947:36-1013(+)